MTDEIEERIAQRQLMLARVMGVISAAEKAGDAHVVFVKTQRKLELEKQIAELRGPKVSEQNDLK